ncbi:hypothetical protein [Croceibacterium ferulae]|uniref:hypothetical protein n=1 Tax=Croceibacterium ferulae TaxID=1854641 RepID=UPI000EAE9131|nr:hypothetical protein [Croceibacterium ferulae]
MTAPQLRHDGWSPDRTARFLDTLSHRGNVSRAAAAIGLSRETAYCRRRRDPLFARAWAAAMLLAREEGGHILADRELEGVEEEVWFRGEVVGTRIRYDNRLLLAHIARLDRLALDDTASADAARFDELVACLAGAQPPAMLAANDDLPPDRASVMERAAGQEADRQEEEEAGGFGEDEWERERREAAERVEQARTDAGHSWDSWRGEACAHVDALLGDDTPAITVSGLSTSSQILPGTGRGTAAEGGGGGAPAASPDLADMRASTVSDVSTSPDRLQGAGTLSAPETNRAERRRRGRKCRPALPNTRSGRHAHPPLQRRS